MSVAHEVTMVSTPAVSNFSTRRLAMAENKRIVRRLVMLFVASVVAMLFCGLAMYLVSGTLATGIWSAARWRRRRRPRRGRRG